MDLFDEVCDLETGVRSARLSALRALDSELADDLSKMLAADADGGQALEDAAAQIAVDLTLVGPETPPQPRTTPDSIGGYKILRILGEGGMGVVYEAEQELPQRRVAVKVIRGQLSTAALRKRFELETHILGRLNHPGICRIYEAATDEDLCFFAMELVEGKPLNVHADARELDAASRLELLARVCDAVHHAHLRGVIHLDLKPANILCLDDGQPKILDFGIARIVDPEFAMTGMTLTGQVLGTPAYMSPEQTAVSSDLLDARSDVYTLGAIGYELLTDRLPHDIKGKAVPEIIRLIREVEPSPVTLSRPELRGDVETILGKALAKAPETRYQSAGAMAEDIRRYLKNEPIEARAPTAAYQLLKFAKRNRGLVSALGALALALVAGTVISALLAARAERARAALAVRNDALTVQEARASLLEDPTRSAARLKTLSREGGWDDAMAVAREADALGVARELLRGHEGEVHDVTFSADGATLASVSYDGTLRLWDLARRRTDVFNLNQELHLVAYAPGDGPVAVAGAHGTLALLAHGQLKTLPGHEDWIESLAWSKDGLLASAGYDGKIRLWRADGTPGPVLTGHETRINDIAFSADGTRLASAGVDGTVRVWSVDGTSLAILHGHGDEADEVLWVGGELLSAGRDGKLLRWDIAEGKARIVWEGADELKHLVAAGGAIAWAGREGTVRVLSDLDRGTPQIVIRGRGVVRALAFSPDGSLLASAGDDRTVRLADPRSGDVMTLLGHEARVRQLTFSADGKMLASAANDGSIRIWRTHPPLPGRARRVAAARGGVYAVAGEDRVIRLYGPSGSVRLLTGHTDEIYQMAFTPDGTRLASASRDRSVRVWDLRADPITATVFPCDGRAVRVATAPGRVAAGLHTGAVVAWSLETGARTVLAGHTDRVNDLQFAADGVTLYSTSEDATLRVWNAAEGTGRVLLTTGERLTVMAQTPDGERLAAGCGDGTVRIVALQGGSATPEILTGHHGEILAMAWSPDGRALASGGLDRTVRVWRDGRPAEVHGGMAGSVVTLAFTAGGKGIAAGSADGSFRMLEDGGARVLGRGHGPVIDAVLLDDGRAAVTDDEDGLRLLPTGAPAREADVRRFLDDLTAVIVDETGRPHSIW